MWTQRDQIQAYQFVRRRVVSSVLAGDANTSVSPNRRPVVAGWLGVVATLLIGAACAVVGFLHKDASVDWQAGGQILVVKDNAVVYVLGTDRRLHPMVNYTSAQLLVGQGAKRVSVSASEIDDAPRGAPLGIVGAPASVPGPGRLLVGPWLACSSRSGESPAAARALTSLQLGVVARGSSLPPGSGLLVADPLGHRSLILNGERYAVRSGAALTALGYSGVAPVSVSAAWLSSLPAADDLDTIAITGAGAVGPVVDGHATVVGQVLQIHGVSGTDQFFVVRADGLEPVPATVAALVLAAPGEAAAYRGQLPSVLTVASGAVAAVRTSSAASFDGYPAQLPTPVRVSEGNLAVCAAGSGSGTATVTVGSQLPDQSAMIQIARPDALGADVVQVAPGAGALVRAQSSPGTTTGTVYIVTDDGEKFPITSTDAQAALGYGSLTPTPVRSALLALLPTGASLDTSAAATVIQ